MQKEDFLLKHIEFFFNLLKKIVGINFEDIKMEELESIYDEFLRKNFGVKIYEIDEIEIEKYKHLLFDESHRNIMVLFFLRISKFYRKNQPILSVKYFELAKKISEYHYKSVKLIKDKIDLEVEYLFEELK